MNRLIIFLLISVVFGCESTLNSKRVELIENSELKEKAIEEIKEWDFKEYIDAEIQYPLKKLNLKPITQLKSETLRIWKFPGGGSAFEQMLEFHELTSELTFHTYLTEEFEDEKEFSEFSFSKSIKDKEIISELKSIISEPNFIKTEDSGSYCKPFLGCGDSYFVEFTNGKEIGRFSIDFKIEECDNIKAKNSKKILQIMTEIIKSTAPRTL